MSEFVTVARPYAKAAFDFAVEHKMSIAGRICWRLPLR